MKRELELVELTNMCMIVDKKTNKILSQYRLKKDWPGLTLPGGHVENGESIVKSVIREVKEETNLEVKNLIPCGVVSWYDATKNQRCLIFLYKTYDFSGTLKQSDEGINKWLSIEEIKNGYMAPDFKEILSVFLHEDGRTEYFCQDAKKRNVEFY